MRLLILLAALAGSLPAPEKVPTGPAVGSRIPAFEAPDQNGKTQNLKTIAGPKGAMLVFFRSADW